MLDYLTLQTASANPTLLTAIYTLLIAFLLSAAVGITYVKTFRGMSYSQGYVAALILSSIVAATVMQAIGDSLARGLGILGALAIIRFRTNFKDARDIIFMFASLAAGIACGVGGYVVAVVGTFGFILIAVLLYLTPLSQSSLYDGMLRFAMPSSGKERVELDGVLDSHCQTFALITLREVAQGSLMDYAYHVKLRPGISNETLLDELRRRIPTIQSLRLMMQETTIEI
ncbi:MAG: DUF4956 domain-containing protein [Deltaproteobacteria bacterium]|nr:DUF4956 domain-containing protein [Deltaproteobacteria bacterium]